MPTVYLINRTLYPPQIKVPPNAKLGIIVVIPCYNEPDLIRSLESLYEAAHPQCGVEVIVLINDGIQSDEAVKLKNRQTFEEAQSWAKAHSTIRKQFHILYQGDLPRKKAGVGLARKIGMDEAAFRLEAVNNTKGIITGFDADAICEKNYFQALESHFKKHPDIQAASIWYEHPLEGEDYDEKTYQSIIQYELHLRYFTLAKRFAGYPHAYETIGSSMAVRADAYQQQGGMNTRNAGEDFYFLNKFMVLGKLNELNDTTIIPAPRISDRVPFGTGKAIADLLETETSQHTYAFESFVVLKKFLELIPSFYEQTDFNWDQLPALMTAFLKTVDASSRLLEIRNNTTDYQTFRKRFLRWFDPFMLMKFMHFSRDHFYENTPVLEAGRWIMENYYAKSADGKDEKALLLEIRDLWKNAL